MEIKMVKYQDRGLVSVIMLSHGDGSYVVDSVKSILAQTYQNWELLFVAKTDDDESLKPFSLLREEDVKIQRVTEGQVPCHLGASTLNTLNQTAA
jgi:hypothetical protein